MAIHFYDREAFPSLYHNAAFVACRAGFRGPDPGHKVVALFVEPDGSGARVGDFLTGFWPQPPRVSTIWGNPVGLETDEQGALYLTSDWNNHLVLKVEFQGIDASWEGDLPDTLAAGLALEVQATIRLRGVIAGEEPPRVLADLSTFGGLEALALTARDDSTFRLEASLLTAGIAGRKHIVVRIEQETAAGLRRGGLVRTVLLMPGRDLLILDDELAADWEALPSGALGPLRFAADGPVYAGDAAASMHVGGEGTGWTLSLNPAAPVERFGYRALAFAFHPGDVRPGAAGRFSMSLRPDAFVDLLGTGQVDFDERQWQELEIPLDPQNWDRGLSSVLFTGNTQGTFHIDQMRLVTAYVPPATAVLETYGGQRPQYLSLEQNYPNPFNSSTVIPFNLAQNQKVSLAVFNLLGRQVATLVKGTRAAGTYAVQWNGRDDQEGALASGLYFYRLQAGDRVETRKLLLLR